MPLLCCRIAPDNQDRVLKVFISNGGGRRRSNSTSESKEETDIIDIEANSAAESKKRKRMRALGTTSDALKLPGCD